MSDEPTETTAGTTQALKLCARHARMCCSECEYRSCVHGLFICQECDAKGARRERIATAALGSLVTRGPVAPALAAREAVEYADALIAELDKPTEAKP